MSDIGINKEEPPEGYQLCSESISLVLFDQGESKEVFSADLDGRIVADGVDITDNDTELARCFKEWINGELEKLRLRTG